MLMRTNALKRVRIHPTDSAACGEAEGAKTATMQHYKHYGRVSLLSPSILMLATCMLAFFGITEAFWCAVARANTFTIYYNSHASSLQILADHQLLMMPWQPSCQFSCSS